MKTEYEIKVLDIDSELLRKVLLQAGFTKIADQPFRRYVYELDTEGAWLRLRTDGNKSTLTYKHAKADAIDGVQELEIELIDFEATHQLLELIGHKARQYQENTRELYKKDGVEVSIDRWPKIPPYAEIEAVDEATVKEYLQILGLNNYDTTSLPTSKVYEKYNLNIEDFEYLSF